MIKEATGLTDVKTLRARAWQGIADGAMTAGYTAKVETVIALLNEALATGIVCVLHYKRHYFMASGINSLGVKGEFLRTLLRNSSMPINWPNALSNLGVRRISLLKGCSAGTIQYMSEPSGTGLLRAAPL